MDDLKHRTLGRGFAILEAVAAAGEGLSVTELAAITELDKSTTSRLVSSLADLGYLHRQVDRSVILSGKVLRLTRGFEDQFDLQKLARPLLLALRDRVNETVILTVRQGNFTTSIDQVDPLQNMRLVPHVGNTAPLDATAAGRAILLSLPVAEAKSVLRATKEDKVEHPEVRLAPARLDREAERAVAQGYVWIRRSDDLERIAAPVYDAVGMPVAAISVYGPKYRMHDRIPEFGAACRDAANELTGMLRGDTRGQ